MSTSLGSLPRQTIGVESTNGTTGEQGDDPFTSTPQFQQPHPHRFSGFDSQLFALSHPTSSPSQAKRALEAHLAETERRLQDASKLGTTLIQQRKNISDRLRDVETRQGDGDIGPELRQKLINIEKEYNEVGRESARASLVPKIDMSVSPNGGKPPFALDGRNNASPSKFTSEATDSPSKINVPRKQRNQNSNSVHNIEFAAEISTSLLAQVRHLQTMLSEKDEALKAAVLNVARLEQEAEGFSQRLRHMDESEQRYKDENWNLETQIHEMLAAAKEAAAREQKLQQTLASTTGEKNVAQRDLDDLKQNHGKLTEDHAAFRKTHDSELAILRKNINLEESEKAALQRRVGELTSQNQELAKAVASHLRGEEAEPMQETGPDPDDFPLDCSDGEHSPPPSPTKGMPRQTMLESETLKSSLHHAHRMIQNLKGNVHREKTEKLDLKRMLQEARDELEMRKREAGAANIEAKRLKSKSRQDSMKKFVRPNMLGMGRNSRTDVMADEADWEDHHGEQIPSRTLGGSLHADNAIKNGQNTDASDAYQTANDTEDAFETANERDTATESDAFQTGAESIAGGSSDEMTETEEGTTRGATMYIKKPSPLIGAKPGDRTSYRSTASVSGDENEFAFKTPLQAQPQRYRLKLNRGPRRQRMSSEPLDSSNPSTAKNSPTSFVGNGGQASQSLFAELGDLNGGDSGEEGDGTPNRNLSSQRSTPSIRQSVSSRPSTSGHQRRSSSQRSTPGMRPTTVLYASDDPPIPRFPLVDSGTMTEPWELSQSTGSRTNAGRAASGIVNESDVKDSTTNSVSHIAPTTPLNKNVTARSVSGADSVPSSRSTPPRPIWDQPLNLFSGIIPTFGPATITTPLSVRSAHSGHTSIQGTPAGPSANDQPLQGYSESFTQKPESYTPRSHHIAEDFPEPRAAPLRKLSLSPIHSLETIPTQPFPLHSSCDTTKTIKIAPPPPILTASGDTSQTVMPTETSMTDPGTEENRLPKSIRDRILGSVFGSNQSEASAPLIAEDETSQDFAPLPLSIKGDGKVPLGEVAPNAVQREVYSQENHPKNQQLLSMDMADHGSQTLLSAEQIDRMLKAKDKPPPVDSQKTAATSIMKPLSDIGAVSPPLQNHRFTESLDTGKSKAVEPMSKEAAPLVKSPKRPVSTSSMRSRVGQYPPLPPDHQQAIAAAAQRAPSAEPNVMGPPLAPASSYRPSGSMRPRASSRPRTPSEVRQVQSPSSKNGTTPRARYSTARSQMSRRSSVSSFASELDERFNIRLDGMPMPQGLEGGTDPRMIQAITQTMIGEFLWKYTRKAGRGEMSNNRHRRFFWVHPYTRTLYWSDRDPSTAGRAELKAKSVAIEAVRVVTDDNPMPPGLHRKSLVIITPGRAVKFTATTGQRHETWFNALSYLLLRTGPETGGVNGDAGNITAEDVQEFNPSFRRGGSRATGSRISLASFRSQKSQSRGSRSQLSTRQAPIAAAYTSNHDPRQPLVQQQPSRNHGSLSSRISEYWKPSATGSVASARGSISSKRSRSGQRSVTGGGGGSSHANDEGHDSAEDLRRVIERQERDADRLENVRSCCEGRHDVGSLARNGRHHSHSSHASGHSQLN